MLISQILVNNFLFIIRLALILKQQTFLVIDKNDIVVVGNGAHVLIEGNKTVLTIPGNSPGIRYCYYKKPLTPERRFFFIEIIRLGESSIKKSCTH